MPDVRPDVRINQLGYLPTGPKRAVWVPLGASRDFRVGDRGGAAVFTGRTRPWPVRPEPTSGMADHTLDFSDLRAEGEGFAIEVAGARSHPFSLAGGLYRELVRDALAFFYLQRSGDAIDEARAPGYGRPPGHLGDSSVEAWTGRDAERLYPGWSCPGRFDVSGGWYDAGDHGKYVTSGAMPVWQLLATVELIRRCGPRSAWWAETEALLLEECRRQLDWLLRMQVPPGAPHAGMAFHRVHGTQWAPLPCWPHDDPTTRVLHRPSTAAALHLAAAAAHGARVFRAEPAYARRLLDAAVSAHRAADAGPLLLAPDDQGAFGGGPYGDDDVEDERAWAATELWLATGDAQERRDVGHRADRRADAARDPTLIDDDGRRQPAQLGCLRARDLGQPVAHPGRVGLVELALGLRRDRPHHQRRLAEPDTPANTISRSFATSRLTSRRLCWRAPSMTMASLDRVEPEADARLEFGGRALEGRQGLVVGSRLACRVADAPVDRLRCAGELGTDLAHAVAQADHGVEAPAGGFAVRDRRHPRRAALLPRQRPLWSVPQQPEHSSGSAARLRVRDGALSDAQVAALDRVGAPEDACGAPGAIVGGPGNDVLDGTPRDDVICGKGGNDRLRGKGGDDILLGGDGNDTLDGGLGADDQSGGTGTDTATCAGRAEDLSLTLDDDTTPNDGAAGEGDVIRRDVENLTAGNGDDLVRGASPDSNAGVAGANVLRAGPGDDQLLGLGGTDQLDGGTGADAMAGGDGRDTATYAGRPDGVTVTRDDDLTPNDGALGEGDVVHASDIENVTGGNGDDSLTGGEPAGPWDNVGENQLRGGDGADQLFGLGAADLLDGGRGADHLDGGLGNDLVSYAQRKAGESVTVLLDGSATSGGALDGPPGGRDVLVSVESATGGAGDDEITGTDGPNVLTGGPGADALRALGGDDRVRAKDGAVDTLLDCGAGLRDYVYVDPGDPPRPGCEYTL